MTARIIETCCYACALDNINRLYAKKFPVYLRAIATSQNQGIILSDFSEAGNDVTVSSLEYIIRQGTEFVFDSEAKPIDRPDDLIAEGILTRVAVYNGNSNTFEMMFIRNAFRNLWRYSADKAQKYIIPALLVYDSSNVQQIKLVEIALPKEQNLRQECLLAIYLLKDQFKEYISPNNF